MVVISLFAATATFASLMLVAYWLINRTQSTAEGRVRTLSAGPGGWGAIGAQADRAATSTLETASAVVLGRGPGGTMKRMAERLETAGSSLTPAAFYTLVLVTATLPPVLAFLALSILASAPGAVLLLLVVLGMVGAWTPFAWLRSRVHSRQVTIRKELPDVLDLLTLCVEAGLGLDAAFRRVSEEMTGELAAEIEQMLHEVELGKPRRDALADLAKRALIPEIGVVVNAMIQSQQMGTSLGHTLRSQTQRLRLVRRQRAEQIARQASVKMAFPLVLFLMPSMFVVVLGPIGINLFRALTK
jgi:tight adherence protein C